MDYKNLGSLGAYQKFLKESFEKTNRVTKKSISYITHPKTEIISGLTSMFGSLGILYTQIDNIRDPTVTTVFFGSIYGGMALIWHGSRRLEDITL